MANSDYTILVVDDDELNRDMLSRRLERKEYRAVSYTHLTLPTILLV